MWSLQKINKRYSCLHTKNTKIRVSAGIFIVSKDNEVLMERRSDCGWWGIPGGKIEVGETASQAIIREIFEETSITLQEKNLALLGVYSDPKDGRIITYPDQQVHLIDIVFKIKLDKLHKIILSEESLEMKFLSKKMLKEETKLVPPCVKPIKDWLNSNNNLPYLR